MYTTFYGLHTTPFGSQPDPEFLWLGENHKEALSTLQYGILENKGFLLLTGESGTGKSILIKCLQERLDENVLLAVIDDPRQERIDFYNSIARGFGLEKQFASKVQFLIQFSHFLHKADDDGKKVLLVVDDCHLLSQEMLEELRLLSNIEKADAKLINIFFVGQRQFNDMLVQPKNRAVRQRLTLKAELAPFSMNETEDYIRHRLGAAGGDDNLFTVKAIQLIHKEAAGVPRAINAICEKILMAGARAGVSGIDHRFVADCLKTLDQDTDGPTSLTEIEVVKPQTISRPEESDSVINGVNLEEGSRFGWLRYAAAIMLLVGAGIYFWSGDEKTPELTISPEKPATVEQKAAEPATRDSLSGIGDSPAVTVLGQKSGDGAMDAGEAAKLKNAILEKAYSAADGSGSAEVVRKQPDEPQAAPAMGVDSSGGGTEDAAGAAVVESLTPGAKTGPGAETELVSEGSVEQAVTVQKAPARGDSEGVAGDGLNDEQPQPPVVGSKMQEPAVTPPGESQVVVPDQPVVTDAENPPAEVGGGDGAGGTVSEPSVVAEQVEDAQPTVAVLPPMEPRKVVLPLQANSTRLTRLGRKRLAAFLEKLAAYPRATLMVKGFVSSKNNSPENIQLSERRAAAVMKLLVTKGIDEERIEIKGMGNQEPIATNDTREGRRKNRRVEIVVVDDGVS